MSGFFKLLLARGFKLSTPPPPSVEGGLGGGILSRMRSQVLADAVGDRYGGPGSSPAPPRPGLGVRLNNPGNVLI